MRSLQVACVASTRKGVTPISDLERQPEVYNNNERIRVIDLPSHWLMHIGIGMHYLKQKISYITFKEL